MLSVAKCWVAISLLAFGATECHGSAIHHPAPFYNISSSSSTIYGSVSTVTLPSETTISEECSSSSSSSSSTKDITTSTKVPTFTPVLPTETHCSNSSVVETTTTTASYITTSVITTSYLITTTTTSVKPTTTTITPPTITSIATYSPTSFTTQTVIDTCPTTCSITAGTVNLFFWPTGNDFIYPSTYVDTSLDYTFTSPSVYMLVDFIYGTNSQGIVGPSATSKIFALDLDEVSTIVGGTATEQLTLNDLGTDCPQSVDPTAIATLTDSRCDPILAAPSEVKSWAWPCNACGRFGLFDPPYAIPTITGGLIDTTTTAAATVTTTTAAATGAAPTTTAATTTQVAVTTTTSAAGAAGTSSEVISLGPSGIVIVAYYSGTSFTTTIPTAASTVVYDGQTLTLGGDAATLPTVDASLTASTASASTESASASGSSASVSSASVSSASESSSSGASSTGADASTTTAGDPSTTSAPATGSAPRNALGFACLIMSVLVPIGMML